MHGFDMLQSLRTRLLALIFRNVCSRLLRERIFPSCRRDSHPLSGNTAEWSPFLRRRRNPLKTLAVTHQSPSQSRAVKHQSSRRLSLRSGDPLPLISPGPLALLCSSSAAPHATPLALISVSPPPVTPEPFVAPLFRTKTPLFSGMDKRFCSFPDGGGPAHALRVMKTSDHLCQTWLSKPKQTVKHGPCASLIPPALVALDVLKTK